MEDWGRRQEDRVCSISVLLADTLTWVQVEDIPEDIAYDAGRVEGDFDRFGRNEDNAFDAGRDDGYDNY